MHIRDANQRDVPALTKVHNWAIRETTAIMAVGEVDEIERSNWLANEQSNGNPVIVAEDEDSNFLGWAGYRPYKDKYGYRYTVEHSIYVNPDIHAKGVGTALLKELIDMAKQNSNIHCMWATIVADNVASIKLHEKYGFEVIGTARQIGHKFGKWHDVTFMQLITG